jgi:hypothetical protein
VRIPCSGTSFPSLAVAVVLALSGVPHVFAQNPAIVKIKTQPAAPLAAGFSGFNAAQLRNTVEYYDQKFVNAVTPIKPGWLRFPAGTASMAYDWNPASPTGGHLNIAWMDSLIDGNPPDVTGQAANILSISQLLTQAKGGVWLSDFATFANTFGSPAVVSFNAYTDNNPGSATQMALAAQSAGLNVEEWELANEAYLYPLIFPSAPSYATAMASYHNDLIAGAPAAVTGLYYAGLFPGTSGSTYPPGWFSAWDNSPSGLASYTPQYWNAASNHIYPIITTQSAQNTIETLNGILAYGSTDYINSYLTPLLGPNTPIFITEFNCCAAYNNKFLTYIYNGIFLAEYIARLSSLPNMKGVGIDSLYTDNSDYHGLIQSVNDFESYLLPLVEATPTYSTNTATNPNTQFVFYTSAPGLAMQVANQAINSASTTLPTTVTGGLTVNTIGYGGNPIPSIYAQAYQAANGTHYLLITNKSSEGQNITIELNGARLSASLAVTYVSSKTPTAANTASAPTTVQIQTNATTNNPIHVTPYSVTTLAW